MRRVRRLVRSVAVIDRDANAVQLLPRPPDLSSLPSTLVTFHLLTLTHNMSGGWPSSKYVTSAKYAGGGGGSPFQSIRQLADGVYTPVSKIEVFAEDWKITGIHIIFADGTAGQFYGNRTSHYSKFEFEAGELVTKATIWPTDHKDRPAQYVLVNSESAFLETNELHRIRLKTTREREWYGNSKRWSSQNPQNVEVGTGQFIGVAGRRGNELDCLGLVFLSEWPTGHGSGANFTSPKYVGGGGGAAFDSVKWYEEKGYALVSKIEIFSTDWHITGVRLRFTDDTAGQIHGTQDKYYNHFSLQAGELVTKAKLWPSEHNNLLSQIYIKTNKNREWYGTDRNWWDRNPQEIDVGSGLLVGVRGRCWSALDCMALVFLSFAIKKITIDELKYKKKDAWEQPDTLGGLSSPQVVARTRYSNQGPTPVIDWKFGNSVTRTSTTNFSQNSLTTYGTSVPVEILSQVLRIGARANGSGFEWQKTEQRMRAHSESQEDIISWGHVSGQLKVGESVVCQAVISEGNVVLDYEARVTINFADRNFKVTYWEDGVFSQTCWSQAEVAAIPST